MIATSLLKHLSQNKENINVIAQKKEEYVRFTKNILVKECNQFGKKYFFNSKFQDLFWFLPPSLDDLVFLWHFMLWSGIWYRLWKCKAGVANLQL